MRGAGLMVKLDKLTMRTSLTHGRQLRAFEHETHAFAVRLQKKALAESAVPGLL